ncbi:hypothetical protein SM124_20090 [Bacillus sp. 31A1R]|uniref:Lipoprotein n=1 Tax=Robertmurraya mangrovi TaxID=3098077 RepID=A0ABU5J3S2_9BACI|nr:hypothetical protein [Bacillus sp. 31A1R]MDZ5474026.1 hypothetical protein [Bacillus sp. 31A1R]
MKKIIVLFSMFLLLTACGPAGNAIIEWVDFIVWKDTHYYGIYSGELSDDTYVGDKLGKVKFKVADNITNTNYKIKHGDAAFLEKGTQIYKVKGFSDLIVVKDSSHINQYRVFAANESGFDWHFKDVPLEEITKILIYKFVPGENHQFIRELKSQDMKVFIELLKDSKEDENYQPNTFEKDPTTYTFVLYVDGPIAYKYDIHFDERNYYWHPWSTNILSEEIEPFLKN